MKKVFRIFVILVLISLTTSTALACSCVSDSLGKRFKKAKAVFIGKATDDEPDDNSLIQNSSNEDKYSQTLEVIKGFKGVKKKFITVDFDVESLKKGGMCPTLYRFEEKQEYLVFAYGNDYEVQTVCSDTWKIPNDKESFGYEQMQGYIRRLDNSWFRFWTRLNPF